MKKLTIGLLIAFLMTACSDNWSQEVFKAYDDGKPEIVRVYDREHRWIREIHYYESGQVSMEGPVKDGQREGEWVSYFYDGKVQSSGFFERGVRTGPAKVYHENGNLFMEGDYRDGHQTGLWKYYDEQGYLLKTVDYGD